MRPTTKSVASRAGVSKLWEQQIRKCRVCSRWVCLMLSLILPLLVPRAYSGAHILRAIVLLSTSDGTRESITTIECVSAAGIGIDPTFIYAAQNKQSSWGIQVEFPGAHLEVSQNAYSSNGIGVRWLVKHFDLRTRDGLQEGEWRLLILVCLSSLLPPTSTSLSYHSLSPPSRLPLLSLPHLLPFTRMAMPPTALLR